MSRSRPFTLCLIPVLAACSHLSGGSMPERPVEDAASQSGATPAPRGVPATVESTVVVRSGGYRDPYPAPRPSRPAPAPASAPPPPVDYAYQTPPPPPDVTSTMPPIQPAEKPMLPGAERIDRPGLGTTWGEARVSRVRDVPFERAAPEPLGLATLYYNDNAGVEAMASYDVRRAARMEAPVPVRGGLTVSVIDESGAPLEALAMGGRVYVVGEAGRRYSLLLANRTGRRYEVVASVDGLDVVDGRPARVGKRGYVLDPWESMTIDGFRRNHDEVAAFRFGSVGGSYAARTSGDRNVGVIGVAFFDEQGASPWSDEEIERRRSAEPFSDARFAQPPR